MLNTINILNIIVMLNTINILNIINNIIMLITIHININNIIVTITKIIQKSKQLLYNLLYYLYGILFKYIL